jgi:hypothetical protein
MFPLLISEKMWLTTKEGNAIWEQMTEIEKEKKSRI